MMLITTGLVSIFDPFLIFKFITALNLRLGANTVKFKHSQQNQAN